MMKRRNFVFALTISTIAAILAPSLVGAAEEPIPTVRATSDVDAGRYLMIVGACHDCHTDGWAETNGALPETDWLKGSAIGWRGPWGTTYASNLRLLAAGMTEDAWVTMLRTRNDRPPMPWMNVNRLSETDARAIYRYIRWLGVAGDRMPLATAPNVEPTTPYFLLEPVGPRRLSAELAEDKQ
ncbi:MAG: cytochrome C [Gammaproteobacteria bacterium]|nr:cytochrome C [Gammaproteobacteria bacterium]